MFYTKKMMYLMIINIIKLFTYAQSEIYMNTKGIFTLLLLVVLGSENLVGEAKYFCNILLENGFLLKKNNKDILI